jgi:hypothetical protein
MHRFGWKAPQKRNDQRLSAHCFKKRDLPFSERFVLQKKPNAQKYPPQKFKFDGWHTHNL